MQRLVIRLLIAAALGFGLAAGLSACANDPGPSAYQDHGLFYYWNTDV